MHKTNFIFLSFFSLDGKYGKKIVLWTSSLTVPSFKGGPIIFMESTFPSFSDHN